MDATTIRVREPRELLALLPYQLGFRPEDSAVAVALRPPRGRIGLIARVDLPDLAEPDRGPALSRRLVTHLVGDGASRAVLVVYTDEDPRPWVAGGTSDGTSPTALPVPAQPGAGAPSSALRAVDHFRRAAADFLADVAVWVVTRAGYLSLDCDDPCCCPPGGRPLRDLQSTEVGAHMVLAGAMVADSRDTLVPDLPAPARPRRNAERAARRAAARRSAAVVAGADALTAWRLDALRTWRTQLAAARPTGSTPEPAAATLGRIAAALGDVQVRDAVLLSLLDGAGDLPERSVALHVAPHVAPHVALHVAGHVPADDALTREVADALGAVVSPRDGVPPDAATLVAAGGLLERVVAHAAGARRAPALTLLGMLAWWHGDGARAAVLLERALRSDPGHRLAHLLTDALAAGLAPGWVRVPR